jgi:ribosomal protein L7Ae-like RNA K-turn-binding protein
LNHKTSKRIVSSETNKNSEKLNKEQGFQKILTLLHFAYKANKLIYGHDSVLRFMKNKKINLVLVAEDLSKNSFQSIYEQSIQENIELISIGSKSAYSQLTGKLTGIIGVLDDNFKSGIIKHFSLIEVEE